MTLIESRGRRGQTSCQVGRAIGGPRPYCAHLIGIFGSFRREFIVRPDEYKASILFKWPDTNIRKQTQLTVEQDELAVFFRDGKVSGVIQPGVSTLDSKEIPLLGNLVDAATGGRYFKTELYFVSTQEFANLPFGGMPRIERGR